MHRIKASESLCLIKSDASCDLQRITDVAGEKCQSHHGVQTSGFSDLGAEAPEAAGTTPER